MIRWKAVAPTFSTDKDGKTSNMDRNVPLIWHGWDEAKLRQPRSRFGDGQDTSSAHMKSQSRLWLPRARSEPHAFIACHLSLQGASAWSLLILDNWLYSIFNNWDMNAVYKAAIINLTNKNILSLPKGQRWKIHLHLFQVAFVLLTKRVTDGVYININCHFESFSCRP